MTSLEDFPPSTELVYLALDQDGESTQKELAENTHLAARTVRTALSQLEEEGLVEERISVQDARQRIYSLVE